MDNFYYGDRVVREYLKPNSISPVWLKKAGTFIGKIKHTVKYNGPQMACVRFDGNKTLSNVPLKELKKL